MSLVVSNGGGQGSGSAPELLVDHQSFSATRTRNTLYTASQSCKILIHIPYSSQFDTVHVLINETTGGIDLDLSSKSEVLLTDIWNWSKVVMYNPTIVGQYIVSLDLSAGDYLITWTNNLEQSGYYSVLTK